MIAMALAAGPDLLLADEPTTALDVTLQAQILDLLERLRAELGLAVLLITHDLAVVAETCDRVVVMHGGEVVEEAAVERCSAPRPTPTPAGCWRCCRGWRRRRGERPAARSRGWSRSTRCGAGLLRAPRGHGAGARRGGPRGRARRVPGAGGRVRQRQDHARPLRPAAGRADRRPRALRRRGPAGARGRASCARRRRRFQMVFQDPYGSLDPRQRVGSIVAEPLEIHTGPRPRRARRPRATSCWSTVGLAPALAGRYPHELSGGQRQRVGIARALAPGPSCWWPTSRSPPWTSRCAARSSTCSPDLRERLGLAMLLIAHDLAAVEQLADRVAVMYLGRIVELAAGAPSCSARPLHPYTVACCRRCRWPSLAGGRRRVVLAGEPPSLLAPPPGCPFHPRCPDRPRRAARPSGRGWRRCAGECGRSVACFYPGELQQVRSGDPPS